MCAWVFCTSKTCSFPNKAAVFQILNYSCTLDSSEYCCASPCWCCPDWAADCRARALQASIVSSCVCLRHRFSFCSNFRPLRLSCCTPICTPMWTKGWRLPVESDPSFQTSQTTQRLSMRKNDRLSLGIGLSVHMSLKANCSPARSEHHNSLTGLLT